MSATAAAAASSGAATNSALYGSAAISGGSGLIGSIINGIQQRKARKWQSKELQKQRDFESQQADYARAWQEYMWNQENQYNSPLEQLKRGLMAGINPNDIFGSNSANAAMSPPSSPQASAPSGPTPVTMDIGNMVSSSINSMAQNQLLLANARKTNVEANNLDEQMKTNIALMKETINKTIKDTAVSHEQANLLRKTVDIFDDRTKAEIDNLTNSAALAAQKIRESEQYVKNMSEEEKLKQKENIILGCKADIAKNYGMVVDSDGLTALITLLAHDDGDKLVSKLITNLGKVLDSGTDGIVDLGSNIITNAAKKAKKGAEITYRVVKGKVYQVTAKGLQLVGRLLQGK